MADTENSGKKSGCMKAILWGIGIFIALILLGSIVGKPPPRETDAGQGSSASATGQIAETGDPSGDETSEDEPQDAADVSVKPRSDWYQYERKDELRGTTDRFATVSSENSVSFDFPYCCDSRLKITVRKTAQYGQDVIFQISDGQFTCGIYDCKGMISIDGRPETLSLNTSADHDPKVLFAKYPAAIIKRLKSSETVIVELPFYQEGNRQFKFNTQGLDW
jgi:hypothetical protein